VESIAIDAERYTSRGQQLTMPTAPFMVIPFDFEKGYYFAWFAVWSHIAGHSAKVSLTKFSIENVISVTSNRLMYTIIQCSGGL